MVVDIAELLDDLNERRRLAAKRYEEDPLPDGNQGARLRLQAEIEQHDLARHVVELEMQGYTILPPGKAAPTSFTDRLRATILRLERERLENGLLDPRPGVGGLGHQLHHLLPDDPVFEEAITNPVVLTLVTYLAGYRAKIATTAGLVKSNESDEPLRWHCDNTSKLAMPWPNLSSGANVNWLLTDYSKSNGALCVVPGSHTWCRHPDPGLSYDDEMVKVIEAPAGSIAVWHTNLWHAAVPRSAEGTRVTFVSLYLRSYLQPSEPFALTTTRQMIDRNSARFAVLTGLLSVAPYGPPGPQISSALEFSTDLGRWG